MRIRTLLTLFALFNIITLYSQEITTSENWKEVFDKYKCNGTIVLYNSSSGETKTFNEERADSGYLPASTFKIINSMIALETKAAQSVNDTIKWDGVDRGWHKWNRDQTIKTGFPISCVWFYQELARRIGEKNMQQWIDAVGYGNSNICCQIDNFWLEGELRISANEQVKFIERLINNELPFNPTIQETVKKVMISDSTDRYVMHSKTGGGLSVPEQVGWFVGYIKTQKGIWITALNIDLNNKDDSKYRQQIVYDILKLEGIID